MVYGFWIAAGMMGFVVGAVLMRALRLPTPEQAAPHLTVYRDQLAEVERDLARDVIAPEEATRLRTEVSRRLIEASKSAPLTAKISENANLPMLAIFAAVAGALGLYLVLGVPEYEDLPLHKRLVMAEQVYAGRPSQAEMEKSAPSRAPVQADAQFTALITQLRDVVAKRPNDVTGLTLLARNEAILGNYAAASAAYQHLIAAKGDTASAEDHLNAAQTMIATTGGLVSAEAEAHLKSVLQIDPRNGMARYFSGLMFAQTGRPDRAFALWEPLLREGPQTALYIEPIGNMIQDLADAAGIKYAAPDAKGPSASDIANAEQMTDADRQDMIKTMVAGLESRLMTEGGSVEEWRKLINALGVLQDPARQAVAIAAANKAYAGDAAALQALAAP
jgi:cytochrome c-type biogenesis protein CcmH